ncbi:cobyrinate a,c-diamide synthase [Fodinicurvata sp. EGI_FJ10296]|uniref:cobyrinate a,c-diamide synthase n=1 Tax=Fodinicurvata sp. EGI_FJ10296 TaxID=3231908 RepID=UPI0034539A70
MTGTAARGLIIAAPSSGTGKTTVTLGLLAALRDAGLRVGSAKVGPDYIDPSLHRAVTGRPALNLDGWAMDAAQISEQIAAAGNETDLILCEGVMGLFDGAAAPGKLGHGSTADIAALTGWPVVLVIDPKGQTRSAAALVKGFAAYRGDVEIAGVIVNNVASDRHRALVAGPIEETGVPVLGAIPRDQAVALPSRHLGLVQAGDDDSLDDRLAALSALTRKSIDLDRLQAIARPAVAGTTAPQTHSVTGALKPLGQRIAVARDAAFTFCYDHVLMGWRVAGAEIAFFSPLADEPPPETADAVYLPGGYPELHADTLAAASRFKSGLARFALAHPVYGECGGYIVMGEILETEDGRTVPMTGLLPLRTSFAARKLHLGYRRTTLRAGCALGPADTRLLGHEFHYVAIRGSENDPDSAWIDAETADGRPLPAMGLQRGHAFGSFLHILGNETD